MKLKNILITGGAGFIGSSLAVELSARGYTVTVLDSLSEQIHGKSPDKDSPLYQSIAGKVNFMMGDITNRADVEKAVAGQDAVVHLAAETGTGQSMYQLQRYSHVNVTGTAVLLDVLVNCKNSVQKFVLASSRAVYGEGKYLNSASAAIYPESRKVSLMQRGIFEMTDEEGTLLHPVATDENSELHPTSFYGLTKLQQEDMVRLVCPSVGISFVILRYQNVYGAGQSLLNPYTGILSIFSNQILTEKSINIFEDGLPTRDFVNINDAVEATIRSLEMGTSENQIINVGSGSAHTVRSVTEMLVERYGKDTSVLISGDFRIGDIRHNFADLSKMKSLLGFAPQVSFKDGIHSFTDWVMKQSLQDNNFDRSLEEMKEKGFLRS